MADVELQGTLLECRTLVLATGNDSEVVKIFQDINHCLFVGTKMDKIDKTIDAKEIPFLCHILIVSPLCVLLALL